MDFLLNCLGSSICAKMNAIGIKKLSLTKFPAPVKAHKIKSLFGRSFVFAQTLSRVVDGDKILAHLNQPE